ncbi:MAG: TraB/GumN family protein [Saprospiraceae bacterium]|nr:TraB/GumN family protein [Saprospiraceae bacterium]
MKQSLLWKIQLTSTSPVSYVFGSMHIGRYDAQQIARSVLPYIDQCAVYAGETDIEALSDPEFIHIFELEQGCSLEQLYPGHVYEKLWQSASHYFDLDLTQLSRYSPFFIMSLISQKVLAEAGVESVDKFLWNYARERGAKLTGLESIHEQIAFYRRIPMEYQCRNLKKMLLNISGFQRSIKKLNKAYIDQDLIALYRLTRRSLGSLRQMMLNERNALMSETIHCLASGQATFITVGAAHLPGAIGLLRLLKKKHYKVTPVRIN